MGDERNYEDLANAIIVQAAKDYRLSLKAVKANPRNRAAKADCDELERFFRSEWFSCLTVLDGETLITSLNKEVDA